MFSQATNLAIEAADGEPMCGEHRAHQFAGRFEHPQQKVFGTDVAPTLAKCRARGKLEYLQATTREWDLLGGRLPGRGQDSGDLLVEALSGGESLDRSNRLAGGLVQQREHNMFRTHRMMAVAIRNLLGEHDGLTCPDGIPAEDFSLSMGFVGALSSKNRCRAACLLTPR